MYVCICRSITDSQVTQAVCQGARHIRDINHQIGKPVQCGKCCHFMKQTLQNALTNLEPA